MKSEQGRYSLWWSLLLLVMACILPLALVSGYLAVANFQLQRMQIYSNTLILSRKIASEVDRELSRIESGLRVLATSSDLLNGDFPSFHQRARDAVKSQIAYNYILTDRQGRQVLNTLRPFGTPLPTSGTPKQLDQVFVSGVPVLTDVFIGPVTHQWAIAIGVPVFQGNRVTYSLNIGLAPDRIREILLRHKLAPGWVARVLDSSGAMVAYSEDQPSYVGLKVTEPLLQHVAASEEGSLEGYTREGEPVVTSFCRTSNWNWTVAISAPKAELDAELHRLLAWFALGTLAAMGVGLWFASGLARRVLSSVRALNAAARSLGKDHPLQVPGVQLKEADAVCEALVHASEIMQDARHRAYHDGLTGLANRVLLEELVKHQLTIAERAQSTFALLAVDLDGFKAVNDQQGHAVGDSVLKETAQRMRATIRSSDTAARIGGDEFSILLCEDDEAGAMQMAQRLVTALSAPFEGVLAPVSASIGVAVYPNCGKTVSALMQSADRALYQAKKRGKKCATMAFG